MRSLRVSRRCWRLCTRTETRLSGRRESTITWLRSFCFIVDVLGERDLLDRELFAGGSDHASGGAGAEGGTEDSGIAGCGIKGLFPHRIW